MACVIPSCLGVGEPFSLKLRILGPVYKVASAGAWNTRKPALFSPFNLNVQRAIQFMDNSLPEWSGTVRVDGASALEGDTRLLFDGTAQGAFPGDKRPIKVFPGYRWTQPGFHFIRLVDEASGMEAWSNPVCVTATAPRERLFWGDPHWQTFFSDGIRCPEELYAFARNEGFLDFGAISDHMEAVTDRQWDYFQAVTNDYNEPGRFVTLQGQEWTHHNPQKGAPGHRNIYYRGNGGPALRSTDPDCDTLEKLWQKLDSLKAIDCLAIPHHSANTVMGVDWAQGWNSKYEKAVEIHSVWGNSEKPASAGNPMPLQTKDLKGEMAGRHVVDALKLGYRFGFVGGGDIHDGRPGDDLHNFSYPPRNWKSAPEGFTAVRIAALTRENVFDAMAGHRTYATTKRRIYLDTQLTGAGSLPTLQISAASEEGLESIAIVRNGEDVETLKPEGDPRILSVAAHPIEALGPREFCYIRVLTKQGHMAWSSPFRGSH
jgi:hypothetical protein